MLLRITTNEYGTPVSEHLCETCFTTFTVCPAQPDDRGWKNCMGTGCPSYDPNRDADKFFDKQKIVPIVGVNRRFIGFVIAFSLYMLAACSSPPTSEDATPTPEPTQLREEVEVIETELVPPKHVGAVVFDTIDFHTIVNNAVAMALNDAIDTEGCEDGDVFIFYRNGDNDWVIRCGTLRDINK